LTGEWGKVSEAIGRLNNSAHTIGAVIGYATAFSGSPAAVSIPEGFSHPADTNRDGKLDAGEWKERTDLMSDIWSSERGRQARHKLLRLAADGDDPEIAELAREILAGRMEFRDALNSSAYSEILLSRLQPKLRIWADLPESEREYARQHADELLTEAISAIEEIPIEPAQTKPPAVAEEVDDEDFEQRTYLRRQ
jgi:hypothetical protein